MNALQLFRQGHDYISIASHLNTTEAEVERQIQRLRNQERTRNRKAAYLENNRDAKASYRKMQNARDRARLREIKEAHAR